MPEMKPTAEEAGNELANRFVSMSCFRMGQEAITKALESAYSDGLRAGREEAAKLVEGFRTGGSSEDCWTAWGEGLAKNIRAMNTEAK